MLTDFHTHSSTYSPDAVISLEPSRAEEFMAIYSEAHASTGIHPWNTEKEPDWDLLERVAAMPRIVAIGECGLDLLRGAPIDRQTDIFMRHIELSERMGKPMIIHCVKAWDVLLALKKKMKPRQKWGIHGYRGGPEQARQLLSQGLYISLGERFNTQAAAIIPASRLLAETDESHLTIDKITDSISRYAQPGWNPSVTLRDFTGQNFC